MSDVDVSVITAIHSEPIEWIKECLLSVSNQKKVKYEHILILDNPKREKEIIEITQEFPNTHLMISNGNMGASNARNIGIENSMGKYIAILDADDYYIDNFKLKKGIRYMEHKQIHILGTNAKVIDIHGNLITEDMLKTYYKINPPVDSDTIRKNIFRQNYFIHSSVIIKKEVFEKIGMYDVELKRAQDYDLFLRAVPYFKAEVIDKKTVMYRRKPIDEAKYKKNMKYYLKVLLKTIRQKEYSNLWNYLFLIYMSFKIGMIQIIPYDLIKALKKILKRPI